MNTSNIIKVGLHMNEICQSINIKPISYKLSFHMEMPTLMLFFDVCIMFFFFNSEPS